MCTFNTTSQVIFNTIHYQLSYLYAETVIISQYNQTILRVKLLPTELNHADFFPNNKVSKYLSNFGHILGIFSQEF